MAGITLLPHCRQGGFDLFALVLLQSRHSTCPQLGQTDPCNKLEKPPPPVTFILNGFRRDPQVSHITSIFGVGILSIDFLVAKLAEVVTFDGFLRSFEEGKLPDI